MNLLLGIDIGTSGVRTAVIDPTGKLIAMARQAHLQQDSNMINAELWWQSVKACIKRQNVVLREQGQNPREITSLAVDGTSGTMVLTDANLQPVTRALMYNSKGFAREAEIIGSVAPEFHITRGSNSALARALYLNMEDPENRACHLLHQADFIAAKLTEIGGYSDYNNSLKTGFDPECETWPAWISAIGLDMNILPKVVAPGTCLAPIARKVAEELDLPTNVKVFAGTTDSIAAFLACADPLPGVGVTSLGTTLVIKVMSRNRIDDPEIGLYSHRLGTGWLVGGASNTGGGVLANYFTTDEIKEYSSKINPEIPLGLNYYPLVSPGERFPINDPDLQPRLTPRPKEKWKFLQGLLEGMAKIEVECFHAIKNRGGNFPQTLYTSGGGAENETWTAIRENVLGQPIQNAKYTEAAIGTARLVLKMGTGII